MIGWQGPGWGAGTRGRDSMSGFDEDGFPGDIEDWDSEIQTYDVNTNTNYNAAAQAGMPVTGMQAVTRLLGEKLTKLRAADAA